MSFVTQVIAHRVTQRRDGARDLGASLPRSGLDDVLTVLLCHALAVANLMQLIAAWN